MVDALLKKTNFITSPIDSLNSIFGVIGMKTKMIGEDIGLFKKN